MDPETERRLAAVIMEEASRLRTQAERDGVAAYLAKPTVRGRPNPQFLQATVRSIQQSNRIVEVNEMWRRRSVELEYERKRRRRVDDRDRDASHYERDEGSNARGDEEIREEGLGDEELEEFLHSRVKRGRGAVGSRMDETGPYLPLPQPGQAVMPDVRVKEDWEERIAGPDSGPPLPGKQERDWKDKKRKSKEWSASDMDEEDEESRKRSKKHKKKKEVKEEREKRGERESRSRKKLEKTSKRRK
ncbi:hypothetical protein R1sor_026895 [Riccia sorocarpa]|uniref:Uncharacterized protein n=1 Tax=Riccia sorocarpa TaxID=122646 RepID=A0ABD3GEF4_9MARC